MTRSNWLWLIVCALVVGAIMWLAVVMNPVSTKTPTTVADPSSLPGIATSTLVADATWPVEIANLAARLAADSMQGSTMEGQVLHIHQHLDIFVHGKSVAVPALIGINEPEKWLSHIHVHDTTGVIHVESPYKATFTLGEFFDIWGVRFTKDCIGGYCTDATNALHVYVNGELYQGDPRTLALDSHQEILVTYGAASDGPTHAPPSFAFPAGY